MASVLLTVGELALVAGPSLRPHIGDLLPLIIDAVQDPADSQKRNVAVVTLGNVRDAAALLSFRLRASQPQCWSVLRAVVSTSCASF